jgi:hypothetical protein
MVARAGGRPARKAGLLLLANRRLMDSVLFDLYRGPDTVAAQVVCARARA